MGGADLCHVFKGQMRLIKQHGSEEKKYGVCGIKWGGGGGGGGGGEF